MALGAPGALPSLVPKVGTAAATRGSPRASRTKRQHRHNSHPPPLRGQHSDRAVAPALLQRLFTPWKAAAAPLASSGKIAASAEGTKRCIKSAVYSSIIVAVKYHSRCHRMNSCGNQSSREQAAQPLRGCGMSKDSSVEAINSHCSLLSLLPRLQGLQL